MTKKMTKKERAQYESLTRRILTHQKVTRKQVLRAYELKRMVDAERTT